MGTNQEISLHADKTDEKIVKLQKNKVQMLLGSICHCEKSHYKLSKKLSGVEIPGKMGSIPFL